MPKTLFQTFRAFVSVTTIVALLAGQQAAFAAELSRAAYEDCAARDEEGLGVALTSISADALKAGIGKLDYKALVGLSLIHI